MERKAAGTTQARTSGREGPGSPVHAVGDDSERTGGGGLHLFGSRIGVRLLWCDYGERPCMERPIRMGRKQGRVLRLANKKTTASSGTAADPAPTDLSSSLHKGHGRHLCLLDRLRNARVSQVSGRKNGGNRWYRLAPSEGRCEFRWSLFLRHPMAELKELADEIARFRDARNWAQFHTPRN